MTLSDRPERRLGRIEVGLNGSDPHLGAMFVIFARLYADENMPASEQIPSGQGCSRPAIWIVAVWTLVATAFDVLFAAAFVLVTAKRRARAHPPDSKPERSRYRGEVGDGQESPGRE